MGSSSLFKYYIVLLFMIKLCTLSIAEDDSSTGYHGTERDALLVIQAEFNNPVLQKNWTGLVCYLNSTPNWYGVRCIDSRVTGLVLENLGLTGKLKPNAFVNLTQLQTLSFKNNSLKNIDLSSNRFDGEISPSLLTLNSLESLQVQNNKLNGPIPPFNQSILNVFNVSNNNLSGEIPNTTALGKFGPSSYLGNKDLCGPPLTNTTCTIIYNDSSASSPSDDSHNESSNRSKSSMWTPILVVINVMAMVVLLFLAIYYFKKTKRLKKMLAKKDTRLMEVEKIETNKIEISTAPTETRSLESRSVASEVELEKGKLVILGSEINFELDDLLRASAEGLGKGNFGNCYKAMLVNGPTVVVKRLRDLKPLTNDEFVRQVRALGDRKHPNLLPILGYYNTKDEKLLLLKFAPNGSLYNRLHGGKGTRDRIPFQWSSRLSVVCGVARALEYLHLNVSSSQATTAVVPHGNLKSSNILLDENDDVCVADYGLTSLIALPIATQRMVSYRSPEYLASKKVSRKSDIWSFGCLLLELLIGRISSHSAPQGVTGADLCSWVHRAVREEWTAEIFDTEIAVQRSAYSGMLRLLQIAIRCCDKSPEKRPELSELLREVESINSVVLESEDKNDQSLSMDQSITDDSIATATPSR
ncbi:unnamed protein product [Withania somnifera]